MKERLPFAQDIYVCFRLALLRSVPYFFSLSRSHSLFLCIVVDAISYNIDRAILFVFGCCNVHYKDWLTYYDRTDRPGELCYKCEISVKSQMTLLGNFDRAGVSISTDFSFSLKEDVPFC